jgi:hypothetical protein
VRVECPVSKGLLTFLLVLLVGMMGCRSAKQSRGNTPVALDPILSEFLDTTVGDRAALEKAFLNAAIRDRDALRRQNREWVFQGASLDEFVYLVFTGAITIDRTADGAAGMAQLADYLGRKRPTLPQMLLVRMDQFFYASKENQTEMRGKLLATVRYVIDGPEM